MSNPIKNLQEIVKDPIEFSSITLPSAALAILLFTYKQDISQYFDALPALNTAFGLILFLVVTIVISILTKAISHDLLNWIYDKFYRDWRREREDCWYNRLMKIGKLSKDPLVNNFERCRNALVAYKHAILTKIEIYEIQSKIARSISLALIFFMILSILLGKFWIAAGCAVVAIYMIITFVNFRWTASELIYQTIHEVILTDPKFAASFVLRETEVRE